MGFLQIPGLGKVHYHEYGSGAKPMLAFHGYGMTGKQFIVLRESILTKYHVYGFDHFFHGQSELQNYPGELVPSGMSQTMVHCYLEEWFKRYGEQKISLMAYSIGARQALILLEKYPQWIEEIILMAPDGLSAFKGFDFLTHNTAGKYFFRMATKSRWLAPVLLKSLKRLRMIDESLYYIAYNEIDTQKKRQDVYDTLNLIAGLRPEPGNVALVIKEHQIKCTLIFGRDDRLFPRSAAAQFIDLLPQARVHEVALGHWLVVPALDEYLLNLPE